MTTIIVHAKAPIGLRAALKAAGVVPKRYKTGLTILPDDGTEIIVSRKGKEITVSVRK